MTPKNPCNGTPVVRPIRPNPPPAPAGTESNGDVMPKIVPLTMPESIRGGPRSSTVERWRDRSLERELARLDRIPPEEFPAWARRRDRATNISLAVYFAVSMVIIGWGAIGIYTGTVEFPFGLVPYVAGVLAAAVGSNVVEHVLVALYVWGPVKNRRGRR